MQTNYLQIIYFADVKSVKKNFLFCQLYFQNDISNIIENVLRILDNAN